MKKTSVKVVPKTEEEVMATVQSQKQARRLLSEMAKGWSLDKWTEETAIYTKVVGVNTEELSISKKGERQWLVVKRIREGI